MPRRRPGYLVDVQADHLHHLRYRVVVPLLPADQTPPALPRLNPRVVIDGSSFLFVPNAIATLALADLGASVGDVSAFQDAFNIAFEVLLKGFP